MSKEPKARNFNLDEIMKNIEIKNEEENDSPLSNISLGSNTDDKASRAVDYLNRHWNLSQYEMVSKRRNFAGLVTLYKKFLGFLLKPFMNVIIFKQAEFNAQIAQVNTTFLEKISNLEKVSKEIGTKSKSLKKDISEDSKKLEQKLQQFSQKINSIEKNIKDTLQRELNEIQDTQSSLLPRVKEDIDNIVKENNSKFQMIIQKRLDGITLEIGEFLQTEVSKLQKDLEEFQNDINQKLEKNLSNMTQMILESGDEEESDFLKEIDDLSESEFEEFNEGETSSNLL